MKNTQLANAAVCPQTSLVSSFCPEARDWTSFIAASLATNMPSYYQATSSNPGIALNSGQGIDKGKNQILSVANGHSFLSLPCISHLDNCEMICAGFGNENLGLQ